MCSSGWPYRRLDAITETLSQVIWVCPHNVIVLARVEVYGGQIGLSDSPDHWQTEAHSQASLKIHASTIVGKIRDHEP
jgi:hypothetical protein